MIRRKWLIGTGVLAMTLCFLLAACAPKEEDQEIDNNEVSVEDRSDDSDEDITEDERDAVNEEEKTDDGDEAENNLPPLTIQVPLPEVDDSALDQVTYISHDFLNLLISYIQTRDASILTDIMVAEDEMTDRELETYADDPVIAEHISYRDLEGGLFLKVDWDNDGIEDIFAWYSDGGSMGNSTRHFLQGQADGSFQCTTVYEDVTQEIFFLNYDDTVYQVETDFDYNRKTFNGFCVSLYRGGEILESVRIAEGVETYEPAVIYQSSGYEELAEKYAEEGRNGFWEDGSDSLIYETGSAETREDTDEARRILRLTGSSSMYYRSDLNNDGEPEWYGKAIFYPSSMGTVMGLDEMMYEEGGGDASGVRILEAYLLGYEGIPLYFWVDTVGDKQIFLLLSYKDAYMEYLYGYLIEGDHAEKVMEIDYIGNPVIRYENNGVYFYNECPVMSGWF